MPSDFSAVITDSAKPSAKVISLKGELDESVLDGLKTQLDPILNDTTVSTIVFNLQELEFINSKGIGFIVSIHTHLSKDARKMIMVAASEEVMDVISLVGLTSIIPYFATMEEATATL
ncbi:STAS domain-containing protein [Candidatus Peregrinibacteria bacterium]|nr:STAS domain-containing protein [Candidatus Peregrinibacteria bacterium]